MCEVPIFYHIKFVLNTETPDISIVAVHGLGSNPKWTWNYDLGGGKTCMWLKHLLPEDLPNTRIMAFNRNSKWNIDAPVKSIEECGHELLNHLRDYRKVSA